MKTIALAPLAVAVMAVSSLGHALPISGSQSDNTYIEVGESTVNGGPHQDEKAGIGVDNSSLDKTDKIDFGGIEIYSDDYTNTAHHTVYVFDGGAPLDHGGMGVFTFAEIGSTDVYYGEWSTNGASGGYTNRAVYYVGDKGNVDSTMPTSGTATYSIQGVSKFNESTGSPNDLSGSFTANFGASTLTGDINNGALEIEVDADISGSTFSGDADAYDITGTRTHLASGDSEGEFYGSAAAALAGMATFSGSDSQYNTAFGGEKD